MTTPTPQPARAEPVGGVESRWLSDRFSDDRCRIDISYRSDLTPEERNAVPRNIRAMMDQHFAAALAPAPDAGLAEVERLLWAHDVATIRECDGASKLSGDSPAMEKLREVSGATTAAILSAFAAQAAIIATLRAERDRLQADAAGRGEGVSAELRALSEKATQDWCIYSEPEVGLPPSLFAGQVSREGFGPIEPLEGYDLRLAEAAVNDLRARIAAAPAPATDGTGGGHHG